MFTPTAYGVFQNSAEQRHWYRDRQTGRANYV